jgi:hypothetical protein
MPGNIERIAGLSVNSSPDGWQGEVAAVGVMLLVPAVSWRWMVVGLRAG